jgi:copper chaperone CopZ
MNKFFSLIAGTMLVFLTAGAMAETATFKVEGMHCGGCKKMVTKAVCNDKAIAATLDMCEVSVDSKKKIGQVSVISKPESKLDMKAIETAIQSAGEDYKITLLASETETQPADSAKPKK